MRSVKFASICLLPAALVLACFTAPAQPVPSDREQDRAAARQHLSGGRPDLALAPALRINNAFPDDVEGWKLLCDVHLELGNYAEAEAAAQTMLDLRLGKADSAGYLLVARIREAFDDADGALESINSALGRLAPDQQALKIKLLVYAARLHREAGRVTAAAEVLKHAAEMAPGDAAAMEELGLLRLQQGLRGDGEKILRSIVDPGPAALFALKDWKRLAGEHKGPHPSIELILYYAGEGASPAKALELARLRRGMRGDLDTLTALAVALEASGDPCAAAALYSELAAKGLSNARWRQLLKRGKTAAC